MMKKYFRVLLFAALVATLFALTAVAASAANPFSTGGNTYATLPEAVAAVSEGGTVTMTQSATVSGDIVLDVNKTYTLSASSSSVTLTLSDGTLYIKAGTVKLQTLQVYATAGYPLHVRGTGTNVTIESGTFTARSSGKSVVDINQGALTVNGGNFYALTEGTYMIDVYGSADLTVTGGFFTFMDTYSSAADIDITLPAAVDEVGYLLNSYGAGACRGTWFNSTGKLRISGGTFMGGYQAQALFIRSKTTDAVISGGSFYGYRAVNLEGKAVFTGGNFYSNPAQGNSKIIDIATANAQAYIFGGNFDGTYLTAANSAYSLLCFTAPGTVHIYGGTFKQGGTVATGAVIGMDTAGTLEIKSGSQEVNGATYSGSGAGFTKTGNGHIICANADGATLGIGAGSFVVEDNASIISLHANADLEINGGTFKVYDNGIGFTLSGGAVLISAGTFESDASCIINFAMPEGKGSFEITGGIFILNESDTVKGGAVIRTGVGVVPQGDKGQYYDPTEIYVTASADILLSGGTFVDNRSTNGQIIDASVGESRVRVDGALLLSLYSQNYFIDANEPYGNDVRMRADSTLCQYGGKNYYCYFAKANEDTTYSPTMNENASISMTEEHEGIRFTSVIPAAIAEKLPTRATYGTLIAPADYVAAAGGFTHTKLDTLANNNSSYGTTYVDIPAVHSVVTLSDGSITFSGTLINLQPQTYTRVLAAVSYVLLDGVYYYSSYDAAYNAASMAAVAKEAYTTYKLVNDAEYMTPSLYYHNGFSAFDTDEQESLKNYCGYEHTYDVATVTPSTTITVGDDASANLKTAANTTLKNKLTALGYSASGAAILVGNTGTAETTAALSEIEGEGYYIGVINNKIVIVGTTNALTMQALSVFSNQVLADREQNGTVIIGEIVASYADMLALNSDTPFVFSWHRDGNIWQPYTGGGNKVYSEFPFAPGSAEHLYNKEGNEQFYVDYPVVAAMLLGEKLDGSGYNFTYVPDNLATNKGTIQIGITDYAIKTALLGQDAGFYGYKITEGNVVITAFDDSTLRLAKKLFEDDLADFATENGYFIPAEYEFERYATNGFTGAFDSYTGATGTYNVAEEVKRLVTSSSLCPRPVGLQLSGVVNVDNDAIEYYYEGADYQAYNKYCNLLKSQGFTVHMAERAVEGSYFVTYVHETNGVVLHVMLHAYTHAAREQLTEDSTLAKMFTPTLRVIAARTTNATQPYIHHMLDASMLRVPATSEKMGKKTVTKLTAMELSCDLNDVNKQNFGFCYVYTLEDGTFVVLDGGGGGHNSTDAKRLYNLLCDLYYDVHGYNPSRSSPIEITWCLSHGHGDHYAMMNYFFDNYCKSTRTNSYSPKAKVTRLIANTPSNDEMYNSMDPNSTISNWLDKNDWYVNYDGTYMQYYKVHTGQRFFIGNLEIEVMYTHEDIHPWSMLYFNNTSTVLRLTAHETDGNGNILVGNNAISLMDLGDLQVRGSQQLRALWGDYLKSDMVLSAHHGGNGSEALTYYRINAQIILWSHCAETVQGLMTGSTTYAQQNKLWLENTEWLYIFTGQPFDETPANNYHYNPTMTLTKDGVVGLPLDLYPDGELLTNEALEGYANQFIAGLVNEYNGSAGTTFTWGTGDFTSASGYVGGTNNNGIVLWRGNLNYEVTAPPSELPEPSLPDDFEHQDTTEDIFVDFVIEISDAQDTTEDIFGDNTTEI